MHKHFFGYPGECLLEDGTPDVSMRCEECGETILGKDILKIVNNNRVGYVYLLGLATGLLAAAIVLIFAA